MCKWLFIRNGQIVIPPNEKVSFETFDFANLHEILTKFDPASTTEENILPPGMYTWLNGYKQYRVLGAAISVELINEGYMAPSATANMSQPYTPYVAVSFEGRTSPGSTQEPVPIQTQAYWLPAAMQQQRWARYSVMMAPGASRAWSKVKQYCSTYHLSPDKVQNNLLTTGSVEPQDQVPPLSPSATIPQPEYGGPSGSAFFNDGSRYVGFCVGNWNGKANPANVSTYFSYRLKITLYVKLFDKVTSVGIW